MNKINILDEATINKIAAGEVIERPASVIKELIENSIDAGATEIKIEIKGNGIDSIKVVDNGHGMSRDDASIAFLKHATSKISNIHDIETVRTMGFRGEALSSITAVAKVEIVTKQDSDLAGTRIAIHGGEVKNIGDTGAANGTSMLVEDLFYNTPARKKFLKTGRTELAHIVDVVTRNALGHNQISFNLSHDGRELFRSPASGTLFDTIVHIYGPELARDLMPVDFRTDLAVITGYITKPGITRSDKDRQIFFINDRPVSSNAISNALKLAFYTMLPKGRYPAAVLKISLDPEEVDVNVHPTKKYVRVSHELAIIEAIADAVRNSLNSRELIPKKEPNITQTAFYGEVKEVPLPIQEMRSVFKVPPVDTSRRLKRTERFFTETALNKESLPDIQILGQVDDVYILAKSRDELVIIDQHAAHERILYEQVLESDKRGSQELIAPVNLELDSKERVLIKDYIPYLEDFGFSISEFGPDSFAVTSVPNILGKLEERTVVHDIISDVLAEGRIKDETGIFEHVSKSTACRGAIKAGATLSKEQMEDLVEQLYNSKNPFTCPHGRPTIVAFNRDDLDKLFKRI
ncbi:MAG: DNA mismatch repair endonuclease MutL [Methanosarcinales archaeon]|nr:DNA mismatch repair endonuclease MutL [Methanosarcinales archaeon]